MSDYDQTINCKDCKTDFVFTESEQKFYADKGFQTPKRCKSCRDLRKAQNNQAQAPAEQPIPNEYQAERGGRHRKGGRRDNNY